MSSNTYLTTHFIIIFVSVFSNLGTAADAMRFDFDEAVAGAFPSPRLSEGMLKGWLIILYVAFIFHVFGSGDEIRPSPFL